MKKSNKRRGLSWYVVNLLVSCLTARKKKQFVELVQDLDRARAALEQRAASEAFAINGKGDKEFGKSCNRVARLISKIM